MPPLSADTLAYLNSSPYFAALEGRDRMGQDLFNDKFENLAEPLRKFLLAPETADRVAFIAMTNGLDQRYLTALGKIVASIVTGEVPLGSVDQLLQKLDLPAQKAAAISQSVAEVLEPVIGAKAKAVVGDKPQQIPPLTRTVGGIINLRKPNPQ